jgi:DNA repair exonuclease SbcCD ATPase subunit
LLAATYGPAHSLELRTQDDEGREVLLPVVTRSDGSSEIIGQFSGGEKTWDLKALRLALTLVAKQKSGRDFQTAFADEEDGALDLEAAKAFIAMYREFLRLGGFGSIFFISHKPECVGLADHRIVFNGGIHVE